MTNIVYTGGHKTYILVHKGELSVRMYHMPTHTWYELQRNKTEQKKRRGDRVLRTKSKGSRMKLSRQTYSNVKYSERGEMHEE